MIWQAIVDAVDAVESWIVGQSFWVQIAIILAVLLPVCWALAGVIDRAVDAVLAWHSQREQTRAAARPVPESAVAADGAPSQVSASGAPLEAADVATPTAPARPR